MDAVDAGKPPPVESRPALASLARELRNSFSSLSLSMDRGSVSVRRASWDVGREVVQKEPKVVETNDGRSSTADRPGHAKKASLSAPRPASSSSYRNSYALPPPQLHTSLASDSQAAPNSAPVTSNSRIPSPQFSTAPSPNNRIPSPQFSTAPSPLPTQSPSPSPTSPVHPTPSNIMHQFPPPPGPYGHARPMLGPPPFGLPMYPSNGRPPYPSVSRYGPPPPHHPQSHSPQPIHPQHPLPPPHHPYYQTLPHAMTMPRPPAPFQGGMVMGATAPGMGHGGLYGPQAPLSPPSPYGTLQSSQSPQFRPHRNVQQNNNTSFQSQHSANTSQTSQTSQAARSAILSQSQGESLELYRQTAKKSNDPQVQLDFVKHLIAVADAAQPDPTDPKKQKKIQDAMYTEAAKWVKKLAASGGIGMGHISCYRSCNLTC
ncbi:hypothetical protein DFS34DRAFT_200925 [Phlyctochytrium arcticum]|nr:hypothetical protein DFS34DRAFT_200925 [Phlyctochytrium arcticum]